MSGDNPFAVSEESNSGRGPRDRDAAVAEVSTRTIELLSQTRPWVMLIGVLFWIGTVFIVVASIFMIGAGLMMGQTIMGVGGVVYLIFGIIYGYFARSLTGYAGWINKLRTSESVEDLERAIESQKNFWKLSGMIMLLVLGLYVVIIGLVFLGMIPNLMGR